jgi:hypothetical protein
LEPVTVQAKSFCLFPGEVMFGLLPFLPGAVTFRPASYQRDDGRQGCGCAGQAASSRANVSPVPLHPPKPMGLLRPPADLRPIGSSVTIGMI